MIEERWWVHWKCPTCGTEWASPLGCSHCPKCNHGCNGLEMVESFPESELEKHGFNEINYPGAYKK